MFKDFILGQMKNAGIAHHAREAIYNVGFLFFREAFTHESFRSKNFKDIHELRSMGYSMQELETIKTITEIDNFKEYNQLEFLGDKELNVCISNLLLEKYPKLPDGNLTFAFQQLSSEEILSKFGKKQEFFDHILVSPFIYRQAVFWKDGQLDEIDETMFTSDAYNVYDKLIEDTVESFSAALVKAVDKYSETQFGPGMTFLLTWSRGIITELTFDPRNLNETKAPGLILKEAWENIYANRPAGKKFSNYDFFIIDQENRKKGMLHIKAIDPVTRKVVATTTGITEKDARKKAAILANEYIEKNRKQDLIAGTEFKRQQYANRK